MTIYTWDFGSADAGLEFIIEWDDLIQEFTVTSLTGSFDLNALWFSNGDTTSDGYTLVKSDNSLNMNGDNIVWDDGASTADTIVWDDYAKLSSPGLGSEGQDKISFISDGQTQTFTLADFGLSTFDPVTYETLGVRATSVNGAGAIKWVDLAPEVEGDEPPIIQVTTTPVDESLNDISGDGRYLTWSAGNGGLGLDVFWTDLVTGEVKSLNWIGDQHNPHISGDGQTVVFTSTDLTAEIFVWEPATDTTILVPSTGPAILSEISDDGNHVVFSQAGQVHVWDLDNPSVPPTQVNTTGPALRPAISGDGTFVAYEDRSYFANPALTEITVKNVVTGETWVGGDPALMDSQLQISADGNFVVFETSQTSGLEADISLFDRVNDTTTVIAATSGEEKQPSISGDGRFVTWSSNADGDVDIYFWDRNNPSATTHLDLPGVQRNPSISTDGRYVIYESDEVDGQFDIYRAVNPLHDDFII